MADVIMKPSVTRRRFTVDEYHRMAKAGILHEDDRVELIEGEIIQMAAIGSRHAARVNYVAEQFITALTGRAIVSIQNPVRLGRRTEPEPDLALLRPRPDRYDARLPSPDDVLLIVEVADVTLRHDRDVKVPLYAAAGIPEVWIWDLPRHRILVYRQLVGGRYTDAAVVPQGTLAPEAFPELHIRLDEIMA